MGANNHPTASQYDMVKRLTNTYSAVRIGHLWGLINNNNEFMMRPEYDFIDIENGIIWARFRGEKFNVSTNDFPLKYDFVKPINDQHFLVTLKYRKGIIDKLGNVIIPLEYIDIRYYRNLYWCRGNGLSEYQIYSLDGTRLSDHEYEYIYDNPIREHSSNRVNIDFPIVKLKDRYNILDHTFNEVLPYHATFISILEQQIFHNIGNVEYIKGSFASIRFKNTFGLYNFSTSEFYDIAYSKIEYMQKHSDGHEYIYCFRRSSKQSIDDYLNNGLCTSANISTVDIYNEKGYLMSINLNTYEIKRHLNDCTIICKNKNTNKYGVINPSGIIIPCRYDYVYEGNDDCEILIAQIGFDSKMDRSYFRSRRDLHAECDIYNFKGRCICQGIILSEKYIVSETKQCFSVKGEQDFRYYNLDGEIIITSEEYSKVDWFHYNTTHAVNTDGKHGIISDSGEILVPFQFDEIFITKTSYDLYIGKFKRFYIYMFISNKQVLREFFKKVECPRSLDLNEELSTQRILFLVQNLEGSWGVYNSSIGIILDCKYKKEDLFIIDQNTVIIAPYGEDRICIDSHGNPKAISDNIANKMDRHYLYGVKNSSGNIVTQEKYHQINEFENGYAVARNSDDMWGFLDFEGNELMPFIFTHVNNMKSNGTASIRTKDGFGIINNKGEFIITPNPNYKLWYPDEYNTDYWVVSSADKFGIVKNLSELIVPCIYDKIYADTSSCKVGYVVVYNNEKAGVIDLNNPQNLMIECKYDEISIWRGNESQLGKNQRRIYKCISEDTVDFYGQEGKLLFSLMESQTVHLVLDNVIVYEDNASELGVTIKQDGTDYKCDNIGGYNTKYIQVFKKNAWGIYGIEEKCEIIPCIYYKSQAPNQWVNSNNPFKYFLFEDSQSLIPIDREGVYGYINTNNEVKIPVAYDSAKGFKEGLAPIKINDKWGYINQIGQIVIPLIFESADLFYDGMARVQSGNTYGYFNIKGDMIIPPISDFTEAGRFENGLARVENNSYLGYVSKDGTLINWKEKEKPNYDYEDNYDDYMRDSWYAMTDGMYGDMPDGFDGDYSFLGYD